MVKRLNCKKKLLFLPKQFALAESNRLQKINQLFQQSLAEILRKKAKADFPGILLSVTEVRTTADLSISKCYVSVFPTKYQKEVFCQIQENTAFFRNYLGQSVAKSMRKVPELVFYLDESIKRANEIDQALQGKADNPIL